MPKQLFFKLCALITALVTFFLAWNELFPAFQTHLPFDVFLARNIAGWLLALLCLFCVTAFVIMVISERK